MADKIHSLGTSSGSWPGKAALASAIEAVEDEEIGCLFVAWETKKGEVSYRAGGGDPIAIMGTLEIAKLKYIL